MNLKLRLALLVINFGAIFIFQIKELLYFAVSSHLFLFALDVFTQVYEKRLNNSKKPLLALSINFFRIVFCLVFLLPQIISYNTDRELYIINFFLVYFVLLIINLINKKNN
tara:strand:- start:71 stop:403 length:333 start_codon:yes stop_codon:yes gene_type:complete